MNRSILPCRFLSTRSFPIRIAAAVAVLLPVLPSLRAAPPDAPTLRRAGLALGVADAHPALLAAAHWVTKSNGGQGAVREVCDLLLSAHGS